MDIAIIFTVIAVGVALAAQRRSDMKLMNRRFDDVNRRFDDVNRRFDDVNHQVDKRFDEVNRRFDDLNHQVDSRVDDTNKRINDTNRRLEETVRRIEERLDALEHRRREDTQALNAQLAELGKSVAMLAGRLDEVASMVSAAFQAVVGVVATRRGREGRKKGVIEQSTLTDSPSDQE